MDVLQQKLPYTPWLDPALSRMPGLRTVEGAWIIVDEAYAGQVGLKAQLLDNCRAEVLACLPGAEAACTEALEVTLSDLPDAFERDAGHVRCPDGRQVPLDFAHPLQTLAQIVQEDFAILQKRSTEFLAQAPTGGKT